VMQHFVQCYVRSVLIPENYHAYRVAHKDDVNATLIEQTRGGIIVRRERGNLLSTMLHLSKILHGILVARSAANFRTQAVAKAVRGRPALLKLTRNKIRLVQISHEVLWSAMRPGVPFEGAAITIPLRIESRCQLVQLQQASPQYLSSDLAKSNRGGYRPAAEAQILLSAVAHAAIAIALR
jgi:hypothetical protein